MTSRVLPIRSTQSSRNLVLLAVGLIVLLVFGRSLKGIVNLGLHDDRYLQIVVAPAVCLWLLYLRRSEIFSRAEYAPRVGIPLLSVSVLLGVSCVYANPAGEIAGRPFVVLAMVLMLMAAFLLCCGAESFRAGLYPLCCLVLMIPLPYAWMDRAAIFLQQGSAAVAYRMLRFSGIPVLRNGMVFSLPGLDFEVAPECSGIHSSIALLMIALVVGCICLRSGWTRAALIVLTIPIALIKNATRIVTIAVLAARVDRAFIEGPFHHRYGGAIFSIVAVALFVLSLAGLQGLESWRYRSALSALAATTRSAQQRP